MQFVGVVRNAYPLKLNYSTFGLSCNVLFPVKPKTGKNYDLCCGLENNCPDNIIFR